MSMIFFNSQRTLRIWRDEVGSARMKLKSTLGNQHKAASAAFVENEGDVKKDDGIIGIEGTLPIASWQMVDICNGAASYVPVLMSGSVIPSTALYLGHEEFYGVCYSATEIGQFRRKVLCHGITLLPPGCIWPELAFRCIGVDFSQFKKSAISLVSESQMHLIYSIRRKMDFQNTEPIKYDRHLEALVLLLFASFTNSNAIGLQDIIDECARSEKLVGASSTDQRIDNYAARKNMRSLKGGVSVANTSNGIEKNQKGKKMTDNQFKVAITVKFEDWLSGNKSGSGSHGYEISGINNDIFELNQNMVAFPVTVTAAQRKIIHLVACRFKLFHNSYGKEPNRYIVISKEKISGVSNNDDKTDFLNVSKEDGVEENVHTLKRNEESCVNDMIGKANKAQATYTKSHITRSSFVKVDKIINNQSITPQDTSTAATNTESCKVFEAIKQKPASNSTMCIISAVPSVKGSDGHRCPVKGCGVVCKHIKALNNHVKNSHPKDVNHIVETVDNNEVNCNSVIS